MKNLMMQKILHFSIKIKKNKLEEKITKIIKKKEKKILMILKIKNKKNNKLNKNIVKIHMKWMIKSWKPF